MALIVGNTGCRQSRNCRSHYQVTSPCADWATSTLHAVDFTNPLSGAILSTLVTPYQAINGASVNSLGGGISSLCHYRAAVDGYQSDRPCSRIA